MKPGCTPVRFLVYGFLLVALASCADTAPVRPAEGVQTRLLWLPGQSRPLTVRVDVVGDLSVAGGDALVGRVPEAAELEPLANLTSRRSYRWPGGRVPYRIDPSVTLQGRRNIEAAIGQWERQTAYRFVPRTVQTSFVTFRRGPVAGACFSWVGRQGGEQFVYLTSAGSCSRRSLVHELGHTVGLWHEHARSDRDAWVRVNYVNVADGRASYFDKTGVGGVNQGPYDYCSVMHYSAYAFSRNARPTLRFLRPPRCPQPVGGADRLSPGDVAAAERLLSLR